MNESNWLIPFQVLHLKTKAFHWDSDGRNKDYVRDKMFEYGNEVLKKFGEFSDNTELFKMLQGMILQSNFSTIVKVSEETCHWELNSKSWMIQ